MALYSEKVMDHLMHPRKATVANKVGKILLLVKFCLFGIGLGKVKVLLKIEGIDMNFHISACKKGCKLTGKKFGVGTGDVYITVEVNSK